MPTMLEEILVDDFKFWMKEGVIYCKVLSLYDQYDPERSIDNTFRFAINALSEGQHFPILIDLKDLNYKDSLKIFKYLAESRELKALVLFKTFLVNSNKLLAILLAYKLICYPEMIFSVYKSLNKAKRNCEHNYKVFNSLSLK